MGFVWRDVVRDYELDCQGIVNNSNYLRYMEHARHQHLLSLGIDFAALHAAGVDLVVARSEIDFKSPLVSQDSYQVTSEIEVMGPVRFKISQQIFREKDQRLMAQGVHVCAAIRRSDGRPVRCPELLAKVEVGKK